MPQSNDTPVILAPKLFASYSKSHFRIVTITNGGTKKRAFARKREPSDDTLTVAYLAAPKLYEKENY